MNLKDWWNELLEWVKLPSQNAHLNLFILLLCTRLSTVKCELFGARIQTIPISVIAIVVQIELRIIVVARFCVIIKSTGRLIDESSLIPCIDLSLSLDLVDKVSDCFLLRLFIVDIDGFWLCSWVFCLHFRCCGLFRLLDGRLGNVLVEFREKLLKYRVNMRLWNFKFNSSSLLTSFVIFNFNFEILLFCFKICSCNFCTYLTALSNVTARRSSILIGFRRFDFLFGMLRLLCSCSCWFYTNLFDFHMSEKISW